MICTVFLNKFQRDNCNGNFFYTRKTRHFYKQQGASQFRFLTKITIPWRKAVCRIYFDHGSGASSITQFVTWKKSLPKKADRDGNSTHRWRSPNLTKLSSVHLSFWTNESLITLKVEQQKPLKISLKKKRRNNCVRTSNPPFLEGKP